MRIRVEHVSEAEPTLVTFSCDHGVGRGLWRGRHGVAPGDTAHVEFTIDQTVTLSASGRASGVESDDESVRLFGVIESIDDDGVVYFRVASDCLIMLDPPETPCAVHGTFCMQVLHSELELYPYD